MAYRIGRQKGRKQGLIIRGNVIHTHLNNIMSYKCAKYRTITFLFLTLVSSIPLLPSNPIYQLSHRECILSSVFFLSEIEHN